MNVLERDAIVETYLEHPTRFEHLLDKLRVEARRRHRGCPDAKAVVRLFEAMYDRLQELEGIR